MLVSVHNERNATHMISPQDITSLAKMNTSCVSIYLPTHRFGAGTRSDGHHLNSMLKDASHQLRTRGISATVAETILNPFRALSDHEPFWQHQDESLAMFGSPHFWVHYSLPQPIREQLVVNDIFYLRQLAPYLHGNGAFHVLALSQNSVKLFKADQYGIEQIDSSLLPDSMDEALWYEMPQSEVHNRSGGSGTTLFHGQGLGDELRKEAIGRYFQHVDRAVRELLRDSTVPLVLAGVPYYIPIYKELSRCSHICEGFVEGSIEKRTAEDIHVDAWNVVRKEFQEPLRKKIEQFKNVQGSGLTSDSLPDVLEAATEGRVDTLFLGNVHSTLDDVTESMLNTAIRRALNSGAEIFESDDLVTDPSQVRALLRF
jgi:hypothetical protein